MAVKLVKRRKGPFLGPPTRYRLKKWRAGSAGFFAWLKDVEPQILMASGKWGPYTVPSDQVRQEIAEALDSNAGTLVFCWPRRHGKTVVAALIILWRFSTLPNQTIALVANNQRQAVDVCYKLIRGAVEHTPYFQQMVKTGDLVVKESEITYKAVNSVITGHANSAATLYGLKLSVAQKSELHATKDPEVFNTLQGSTLDTKGGLMIVDSTVGSRQSPLWLLYGAAKAGDPDIHISHIEYTDLEDAVKKRPEWISEAKLRSLGRTMLPGVFEQQHLNRWGSGTNALFPQVLIDRCTDKYPLDLPTITKGAPFSVGGGLDRAYGFSLHGDKTVTCAVVRTLIEEQDHFFVLDCSSVLFSGAAGIKKNFTRYYQDWELSRACLESYNAQDIFDWANTQPFEAELIHPTAGRQTAAFTGLHTLADAGQLHISPTFKDLLAEMSTFEYRLEARGDNAKDSLPRFEAATGSKDDFVYALAWAVFSLHEIELNPYTLSEIVCTADLVTARMCVMNGGPSVPMCSKECRSFKEGKTLFERYLNNGQVTHLEIEDFMAQRVTNLGFHVLPR